MRKFRVLGEYIEFYEATVEAEDGQAAICKAVMEMSEADFEPRACGGEWRIDDGADQPEEIKPTVWDENLSHWDEHPNWPAEDWREEVMQDNTRQSYRDWVASQLEAADED